MTTRIKSHPHAALPAEGSASLISDARLIDIYAAMLKCRMLRERVRTLAGAAKQRRFTSGSEAVAAAALIDLKPEDNLISATPNVCAALLKGLPLSTLLRPFCVRASAIHSGSGIGQAHFASGVLTAPSAGANPGYFAGALSAGAAFAGRHRSRENVSIAFYEEKKATYTWREIQIFALMHGLPVIFVRQSARPLPPASQSSRSGKSTSGTLPIIPVDSNDAVAVYRVVHEAIAHARRGSGPTVIDCVPLRLAGERKLDSDCIIRMERYLEAKDMRPERIKTSVIAKFGRALDTAIAATRREAQQHGESRRSRSSFQR